MKTDDFVGWILRSPFHSLLSNGMMLITVTGCRTGTKYTVPVGYYREGEDLWVITSRHRTWWRNLLGGAEVGLVLKGKPVNAHAEPVLDQESV